MNNKKEIMKTIILLSLVSISLIFTGCTSTGLERISTVTVYGDGSGTHEVELSRPVTLPINLSDAVLIMEECYEPYDISLGLPELFDEYWVFIYCFEYPDWGIRVNKNNGNVYIDYFG